MSITFPLTLTVPAEDQGHERRETKAEEFNAMVVKDMGIFELNVQPFLRNKRKECLLLGLTDPESNSEEESAKLVTALTGICDSDSDSSDEEVTFEELADSYKKLCIRSAEVCQQNERQKNSKVGG